MPMTGNIIDGSWCLFYSKDMRVAPTLAWLWAIVRSTIANWEVSDGDFPVCILTYSTLSV